MLANAAEHSADPGGTGARDEDVRQAIINLAVPADTGRRTDSRLFSYFRGYMVHGGESLTLDRLGAASREFSGRLLHVGFDLRFPGDFVPADYGKVMLHLAGAYVAGLSPDARIVIDINGRNAASVPLPDGRGEVFERQRDPPALQPVASGGESRRGLGAAAERRRPSLRHAEPGGQAARFLFLDSSRIEIPHFARRRAVPTSRDQRRCRPFVARGSVRASCCDIRTATAPMPPRPWPPVWQWHPSGS